MRFIVGLYEKLSETQRAVMLDLYASIVYESQFIPVIGVETEHPHLIQTFDFVKYIVESEEGYFQEGEFLAPHIYFEPPAKRDSLVANHLVGWGDTRIAVLDSGVNDQSELNLVECKDFTNTGTFDAINHGTLVTKIVKHFARGANLYVAKVGTEKVDKLSVMRALEWAAEKDAGIINLSVGFTKTACEDDPCDLCRLVNEISKMGIVVVVAAGNQYNKLDSICCPAIATNAVTVVAIDKEFSIAAYSSIGKPGVAKPTIVAPGRVYIDGDYKDGTSFAAPIISGVLGAILNRTGNVSNALEYMYKTAIDLELPSHYQGRGCINIDSLVEVLISETSYLERAGQEQSS